MFFIDVTVYIEQAKREREIREAYWALLPKKEAGLARAKWEFDRLESRDRHERNRQLAEASRPRNFWGN